MYTGFVQKECRFAAVLATDPCVAFILQYRYLLAQSKSSSQRSCLSIYIYRYIILAYNLKAVSLVLITMRCIVCMSAIVLIRTNIII